MTRTLDHDELDRILRTGDVRSVLQPIVDLATGHVVAYEALARGPRMSELESPDALVALARRTGRMRRLDALCRDEAFRAGARAGLTADHSLFVNVEPDALADLVADPRPRAPAVLEITERALALDPAQLIHSIETMRGRGWVVAIDDLGVNPHSLALLPLVDPDIIKLDMGLVQREPDRHVAMIMSAVTAHAEATGALVLAEGIETAAHLVTARALRADLGQGWLFGRGTPADEVDGHASGLDVRTARPTLVPSATPFHIASKHRPTKIAHMPLLLEMSHFLESRGRRDGESAVVLSTFQDADNVTPGTVRRYRDLTASGVMVALLAHGLAPQDLTTSMHWVDLGKDDPLTGEWDVAVVSPDFAALLTARELDPASTPRSERRFEFLLTHDRQLVLEAARSLLLRLGGHEAALRE